MFASNYLSFKLKTVIVKLVKKRTAAAITAELSMKVPGETRSNSAASLVQRSGSRTAKRIQFHAHSRYQSYNVIWREVIRRSNFSLWRRYQCYHAIKISSRRSCCRLEQLSNDYHRRPVQSFKFELSSSPLSSAKQLTRWLPSLLVFMALSNT